MKFKNAKLPLPRRYLSTLELSQYLGKSKWWIYAKIKRREIPFAPVGRDLRFDDNFLTFLEEHYVSL